MTSYGRFPVRSAEEAAELISHGATLGIGGFTDPGCPKAVPTALAQRRGDFTSAASRSGFGSSAAPRPGPRSTWTFRKQTRSAFGCLTRVRNPAGRPSTRGNVNSFHVCGTQMMNAIGGSGDFERNAHLSVFVCPSIAKGGESPRSFPSAATRTTASIPSHIVVTEQGMADLRGLVPAEHARPADRPLCPPGLSRLPPSLCRGARGGHIRHDLTRCFELHRNLIEHGAMLPELDLNQFSPPAPNESSGAVRRLGETAS